ncbi:MAG: hypothetical protein HQL75_13250 [Magnetococcales bacterium]|nr:hypothetical protein [Magnetococcales bacterium]
MSCENPPYPTREEERRHWQELTRDIAATLSQRMRSPRESHPDNPGHLIVMGSGIGTLGFTRDSETMIRRADRVFFCVANVATEVWLRTIRPDALNLYVFYDNKKRRYHTYMQMAEAILHPVRQGQRVVAIFYGHPGIFVLSSHRAVAIARQEGHRAEMRPGISSLDHLCADLGVDPAFPGLQTFEATDLLLRRRTIDICSHVVLWQVGLVGLSGFRRRGFINKHFNQLVDYLERSYGPDHELTHYIAARFPTMPPTMERFSIRSLREGSNLRRFTGISTFYIPPKEALSLDRNFAEEVGLLKKNDRIGQPRPYRELTNYGPLEMKALEEFSHFDVPEDYHFQRPTPGAKFLLAVAEDETLRQIYETDPQEAVSEARFPELDPRSRRLLASRKPGRVQLAAMGEATSWSADEQFVIDLMSQPLLASNFQTVLNQYVAQPNGYIEIDAWIAAQGYTDVSFLDYSSALESVCASLLLPWSGVYITGDSSDANALIIFGNPASNAASTVLYNATRIINPAMANGILTWNTDDGNPNNGAISFQQPADSTQSLLRSCSGKIWIGDTPPDSDTLVANEVYPPDNPLCTWLGQYVTRVSQDGSNWQTGPTLEICPPSTDNLAVTLQVDGQAISDFTLTGSILTWGDGANAVTFTADPNTPGSMLLSGKLEDYPQVTATSTADYSSSYVGGYMTSCLQNGQWNSGYVLYYDGSTLVMGNQTITNTTYSNRTLSWSGAGDPMNSGSINFSVNTLTNQPAFTGKCWPSTGSAPTSNNIMGSWSSQFILSWSGTYATVVTNTVGPVLQIQGVAPPQTTTVTYDGVQTPWNFFSTTLAGTVDTQTSFKVAFSYEGTTNTKSFTGTLTRNGTSETWASTGIDNDITQWGGTYNTSVTQSDGSSKTGPTLTIDASTTTSYSVTLDDGSTCYTIATSEYLADYTTLSWTNQSSTPNNNAYANADICFANQSDGRGKTFTGTFWALNTSPPASANWSGSLASSNSNSNSGLPWWAWLLIGGGGVGVAIGTIAGSIWIYNRVGRGYSVLNQECELAACNKKLNLATPSSMLTDDSCSEEEEDYDETEELAEESEENAFETDPNLSELTSGEDPQISDPDIQIDVDSDAEIDIDSGSDVEVTTEELVLMSDMDDPGFVDIAFVSGLHEE